MNSPLGMSGYKIFAIACRFDEAGNAIVTYLSGEEYTETETTITIP